MLRNVRFIGELFRRQLLTENVMHVCVAMMLDDEVKPQAEIIEAACELITLVRSAVYHLEQTNALMGLFCAGW